MNIVCVGGGYVGSVTGAAFATLGNKTTVIDIDTTKVNLINAGKSPIYEPGLDYLIQKTVGKSLFATDDYQCIADADIVFIGVETPTAPDGCADLRNIKDAAKSIGENINKNKFTVIVNKSTVPIGTAEIVSSIVAEVSELIPERDFALVSNPEFLREGSALQDVFFPNRIIVGASSPLAKQVMKDLYDPFVKRADYPQIANKYFDFRWEAPEKLPIYFETDIKTAEMIKYASNAFLAVKISYINEIAKLCERVGTNILDVSKGMGLDSRIGEKFLEVSSGWQGSCFPKDTSELYLTSKKYSQELTIVKAAIDANFAMHRFVVEKIINFLGCLNGKTIGILGLTFKPSTDDARKTQAEFIIPHLLSLGANIQVFDPQGMAMFKKFNSNLDIKYCEKAEEVAERADCILLLTHWQEFKKLNWQVMARDMKTPFVLDTRNFLNKEDLQELGFYYQGLGAYS